MSERIEKYMQSLLKNPEFIKTVSHSYGNGMITGGHAAPIASITMSQLATAIANLEYMLTNKLPESIEDHLEKGEE